MLRVTYWALLALLLAICIRTDAQTPDHSGYLPVSDNPEEDGALFYAYYESKAYDSNLNDVPIIIWLQGGPGCASLFGAFYELGPYLVVPPNAPSAEPTLIHNPGSWNDHAGLLFIDQPVGTGFSYTGQANRGIPDDEITIAADLYYALQTFFLEHEEVRARPVIIAGESYAGKYVPSIGHFILQQEQEARQTAAVHLSTVSSPQDLHFLKHSLPLVHYTRHIPPSILQSRSSLLQYPTGPAFTLAGLAIGNGLTNPATQVMTHADTAHALGYIDAQQRAAALSLQLGIAQLIAAQEWNAAHEAREDLLKYISHAGGIATLLDATRAEPYDANKTVDAYLNRPEVKAAFGVDKDIVFESCSGKVGKVLGPDVMKSVKYLIPDLLDRYPLLLYQGEHDVQDGPASSGAWIDTLEWAGREAFYLAKRHIIRKEDIQLNPASGTTFFSINSNSSTSTTTSFTSGFIDVDSGEHNNKHGNVQRSDVVAYYKHHSRLTHVVVRSAGHMVPRDAPETMKWVLGTWIKKVVMQRDDGIDVSVVK